MNKNSSYEKIAYGITDEMIKRAVSSAAQNPFSFIYNESTGRYEVVDSTGKPYNYTESDVASLGNQFFNIARSLGPKVLSGRGTNVDRARFQALINWKMQQQQNRNSAWINYLRGPQGQANLANYNNLVNNTRKQEDALKAKQDERAYWRLSNDNPQAGLVYLQDPKTGRRYYAFADENAPNSGVLNWDLERERIMRYWRSLSSEQQESMRRGKDIRLARLREFQKQEAFKYFDSLYNKADETARRGWLLPGMQANTKGLNVNFTPFFSDWQDWKSQQLANQKSTPLYEQQPVNASNISSRDTTDLVGQGIRPADIALARSTRTPVERDVLGNQNPADQAIGRINDDILGAKYMKMQQDRREEARQNLENSNANFGYRPGMKKPWIYHDGDRFVSVSGITPEQWRQLPQEKKDFYTQMYREYEKGQQEQDHAAELNAGIESLSDPQYYTKRQQNWNSLYAKMRQTIVNQSQINRWRAMGKSQQEIDAYLDRATTARMESMYGKDNNPQRWDDPTHKYYGKVQAEKGAATSTAGVSGAPASTGTPVVTAQAGTTANPVSTATAPVSSVTTPVSSVTTPTSSVTTPTSTATAPVSSVTTPTSSVTTPTSSVTTPASTVTAPVTQPSTSVPQISGSDAFNRDIVNTATLQTGSFTPPLGVSLTAPSGSHGNTFVTTTNNNKTSSFNIIPLLFREKPEDILKEYL